MSAKWMKNIFNSTLILALLSIPTVAKASPIQFFFTDFNSGAPSEMSGVTGTADVQLLSSLGFDGDMLFNDTGGNPADRSITGNPGLDSVLTLVGLPEHTSVTVNFLFAAINSWDGILSSACVFGSDVFNVVADGVSQFAETVGNACGPDSISSSPGATELGASDFYWVHPDTGLEARYIDYVDRAFSMSFTFDHTAGDLVLAFVANGSGWQGGVDESWGLDNLEVILEIPEIIDPTVVPEPGTLALLGGGLLLCGARLRRRTRRL